ncbi:MAG: NmrA/HSCARG family protein [Calditrichaceae bacterium]|nr:NmrA/HSCARG family protein [Calditrichia bacterium]NUQ40944.1 NmrA/HSCARG family protein [Calditrichaceae bacterium]
MANERTILITGITGQQGGTVARELLARGYRVKGMTRKPDSEKAHEFRKLGADIVQSDLDDQASLKRALQGVWGVFAIQNTWEAGVEKEEEQGKRIAKIAKEAGVQHYVYSSVGSAHRNTGIPHFENKWRIEETVRGLGFPSHIIIRPVFFMENLASPWFKPGIDQGQLMVALKPETALQMIAVNDIGKYGLAAFEKHKELNGREIDIAGDALTMPETARILSEAAGKKVDFVQLPIAEVRKFSEDYAMMLEWFDRVGYNADIAGNTKEFGIKPTSFKDWAKQQNWS